MKKLSATVVLFLVPFATFAAGHGNHGHNHNHRHHPVVATSTPDSDTGGAGCSKDYAENASGTLILTYDSCGEIQSSVFTVPDWSAGTPAVSGYTEVIAPWKKASTNS